MMQAIEFNAIIQNDSIKIPDQYLDKIGQKARVILIIEEFANLKTEIIFSALSIKTKGYQFNREEANER